MANIYSRRTVLASTLVLAAPLHVLPAVQLGRKVRLAILGFDGHVDEILQPLPGLPDVQIAAISDPDAATLEREARDPRLSAAKRFTRWTEMLDQTQLDVVAVCNTNGERAAAILACIQHGLNVIAEKPLALTSSDLHKIGSEAERRKVKIGILLPMRFEPSYLMMKRVVQAGVIGQVASIAAQKSYQAGTRPEWYRHTASYGGTIPWIGPHMIDLMRFTSGREFREVVGFAANVGAPDLGEMENATASVFRLDNGGVATLRMDFLRPPVAPTHGDDQLRLAGTSGILEFDELTGLTLMTREEKQHPLLSLPPAQSVFVDFLESAYNGKKTDLSLPEILRVSEIVLGAQEAARTGRVVKL